MEAQKIIKVMKDQQRKLGWSNYRLNKEAGLSKNFTNPRLDKLVSILDVLNLEINIKKKV